MARTSMDTENWTVEMSRKRHGAEGPGESSAKYVKEGRTYLWQMYRVD